MHPTERSPQLRVLQGDEALERLRHAGFRQDWRRLAAADPKPTWFQEPAFVVPWYESYVDRWEPILGLGRADDGGLIGLMAVARDRDTGELAHAGTHHAWYHGWIARPDVEGRFPARCVEELFRRHRPRRWRWRPVPPGAPTDWARRGFARGTLAGVRIEVQPSPIWDLEDESILDKLLGQASLRNYINRFERRGELRLEEVEDPDEADRLLRLLVDWCDLRHGAIHGDLPFRDDPAKLDFHRRMAVADRSALMSVLRVDDRPLAIHLGAFDGTRLFLGLHGYDPTRGRLSPGTILMVELAREIRRRGGREIDLTPGGEPWKERYANRHHDAARLELFRRRTDLFRARWTDRAGDAIRRAIRATDREPADVRQRLLDSLERWTRWPLGRDDPSPTGEGTRFSIIEVACDALETPPRDPAPAAGARGDTEGGADIADLLPALLSFDRAHPRDVTRDFLYTCMKLLEKGWRCFPLRGERHLAALVWLQPDGARYDLPDGEGKIELDPLTVAGARFQGSREGPGVVPEDACVAVVCHEETDDADLDPGPLLTGVLRRAAGDGARRVWFVHRGDQRRIREWLRSATADGRPGSATPDDGTAQAA